MALSPNVVVVAAGDLITAVHLNNVRSNLDRLDTAKFDKAGGTVTGSVTMDATAAQLILPASGARQMVGKAATNIDAAGVELYGSGQEWLTTSAAGATNLQCEHIGAASANSEKYLLFRTAVQGIIGSITQVNVSGVVFNTTSDYRLKDDLGPIVDALGRVLALRPIHFAWKADGTEQDGFLAHEVAPVAPYAVTGDKDATLPDDDPFDPGAIDPQQLDASKLVPLLVAALQELTARVDSLEDR